MSSLMDLISEESVIILNTGTAIRGSKEVSQLLQYVKHACYVKGVNTGLVYGALISLGVMGSISLVKKFKNRKKEA